MLCGMTIAPSIPMATTMLDRETLGMTQCGAAAAMSGLTMKSSMTYAPAMKARNAMIRRSRLS